MKRAAFASLFAAALLLVSGAGANASANTTGDALPANEGPHAGMAADGRVWYVPMRRKEIALTFDDGPYPFYTPLLLHQLAMEEETPATFFLVGRTVQEYPQLVERILSAGGEIGNHTYNHYELTGLTDHDIENQIVDCGALLAHYTGSQPTLFRPPHGRYDARVVEIARDLGYRVILWSDAPDDAPKDNSDLPVDLIVQRVIEHARPGGIILLHSGQYNTIEAIPQIVDSLRAEGYKFVTVSQLLSDQE